MKKKKKLRLKKQAYISLAIIIFLIVGIILGNNYYNDYKYKQTNEYKLTVKGYTLDESKDIINHLNDDETNDILARDKIDDLTSLLNEKYFLYKNLDTYLTYREKESDYTLKEIVAIVNVHANNKWYNIELKTNESLNELMLVNKFYALTKDYTPKNLTNIGLDYSYGTEGENKLIDYAYEAFQELWDAAYKKGYYLMVTSSYRDYASQEEIYNYRKTTQGERKADETAARPGHSEHQTGLVVDMTSKTEPDAESFTESKAYAWLKENAYKYGYIERYPEGKTYITGYSPESWHWRYVGREAAKVMRDEDITYDEYYAYYIEK